MRRFVNDLYLSSTGSEYREVVPSLLYMIPATVIALVLYRDLYSGSTAPSPTSHEVLSFNMALNARFCATTGRLSSRFSPYLFLTTRVDLRSHPFEDAIVADAGSVTEYCRTVTEPYVVSENSLMWLARAALWADPVLTPDGLGRFFGACRVFMLLVFGFSLVRTGAPVSFTLAAVLIGCAILRHVGARDTPYPFVLALSLLHAGAYGLAAPSGFAKHGRVAFWIFAFGMGILTAHSAATRTILLPMSVAMFGLCLFAAYKARDPSRAPTRIVAWLGVATLAFGLGYVVYVRALVEPLRFKDDRHVSDYTYHTLAHPLVLGLAVPESDFSRREGIKWDDRTGLALAQTVMPGVELLGPRYESALLRYYGRLWIAHPRDMAMVYLGKLRWTGSGVFLSVASVGEQFGIPNTAAEWLDRTTNGVALLVLGLVTFGIALRRHVRCHSGRMLITALVSIAALSALGEAFLMHSIFVATYYAELLFFLFFAFLISAQAGVDLLVRTAFSLTPTGRSPHHETAA